jgi:hypothetical protein
MWLLGEKSFFRTGIGWRMDIEDLLQMLLEPAPKGL